MDFGFYVAFHYITPIVNGNKIDLGKMKANLADLFFFSSHITANKMSQTEISSDL